MSEFVVNAMFSVQQELLRENAHHWVFTTVRFAV